MRGTIIRCAYRVRISRRSSAYRIRVTRATAKRRRSGPPDAIAKWNGKTPAGYQQFAAAFEAGSAGGPGARGALLALIGDPSQPAVVRASSLARLAHWMTPTMLPAVSRALNDPDAVVRLAAVEALAATDPSPGNAISRGCWTIPCAPCDRSGACARGTCRNGSCDGRRARFDRALAELIAVQTYNR
jgi:hypothetical protein